MVGAIKQSKSLQSGNNQFLLWEKLGKVGKSWKKLEKVGKGWEKLGNIEES